MIGLVAPAGLNTYRERRRHAARCVRGVEDASLIGRASMDPYLDPYVGCFLRLMRLSEVPGERG